MDAYRERRFQRIRRQVVTIAQAVQAGRARVRATPPDATVDGEALRELVAEAALTPTLRLRWSWHWSCALPEGFAYRCPLEHWRRRETFGRWVDDDRPVLADHQVAIGGPVPARVVRCWLISASLFQGGIGRAEFGRIELVDGERVIRVL